MLNRILASESPWSAISAPFSASRDTYCTKLCFQPQLFYHLVEVRRTRELSGTPRR
jgi:hypothetical protein